MQINKERNRIKSIRNQTLVTLLLLLRNTNSLASILPMELWISIMQQLDFPSFTKGYRTSEKLVDFLIQKNILTEFNQRLQSQQSLRLVETHGTKLSKSRFNFLVPQTLSVSAADTISLVSHECAQPQRTWSQRKLKTLNLSDAKSKNPSKNILNKLPQPEVQGILTSKKRLHTSGAFFEEATSHINFADQELNDEERSTKRRKFENKQ